MNVLRVPSTAYISFAMLFFFVAVLATALTVPFLQIRTLNKAILEKQDSLPELRTKITRESQLKKEHAALTKLGQDTNLLLDGDKTGVAGANLQSLINRLVTENGGSASSIQILPPKKDGNLMRISVSLSINVGLDGLRDIVHSLETGTPLIFIDDIVVRSIHSDFHAPDPHYLGPLDVTLQLSGFARQGAAEP